ncbi:cation:proton antiporter [Microbacter sp. GSS18]|nr:cation:proton antiporter [Microbacter sp. GSS18]
MEGWGLVIILGALIAFAPFSKRLAGTPITPAIVFTGVGFVLGTSALSVLDPAIDSSGLRLIAELSLTLVLFSDAASLDVRRLRRQTTLPARLLLIALPLTIVLGALLALPLFPELSIFSALALAVMLAPTDAALGQAVVSDRRLPTMLRQGLNAESGLNDGICVPILVAAIAFAEVEEAPSLEGQILVDLVRELSIALAVGIAIGLVAVGIVRVADRRGWISDDWAMILAAATALLAYTATDHLHGSGFIAAFTAGIVYGRGLGPRAAATIHLDERVGQMLSAATFLLFGAVMVGPALAGLDVRVVVYAVLSLTVVRMLPVAVSLLGSGASMPTVLFAGWFGPRGLATIVFALIIIDESDLSEAPVIMQTAVVVVLFSVIAHGLTAPWLTARYARWLDGHRDDLAHRGEAPSPTGAPGENHER